MNVPSGENRRCTITQREIYELAEALTKNKPIAHDSNMAKLQRHIRAGCSECGADFADRMDELSSPLTQSV